MNRGKPSGPTAPSPSTGPPPGRAGENPWHAAGSLEP